jgi:hypothetical protein
MFKIKAAVDVPARKQPVFIGAPDFTYPDLVFTTSFSADTVLSMNSMVLRTALIASAEFLEKNLKIKIIDLKEEKKQEIKEEVKQPVVKEVKPIKKKTAGDVQWK